ncbi:MAG: transporter substrate-binding domain-containing protein [Chthoniobacterales bacterium]
MRRLLFCFCLIVLTFGILSCHKSEETLSKDTLVVGMDLSYPPFETIDEQGNPTGVSVDLAKALGEYLGKKIKIQNIPFAGLIPSLKTNKIDLIISSMTATPERRESIAFSDPYLTTGLAILVRKNSIAGMDELDLPGKTVVVRQGTTGQNFATKHIQQAKVVTLDKESSAVLEVVQGKADGFIYDQMSVWKNWQAHPDTTTALLAPLQSEGWAIGMRKNDDALQTKVNAFLKKFKTDGGFVKLGDKYLRAQKEAFKAQKIPFMF